ncbi:MAG: PHP domain-containing protein [Candidatus Nanohaloarchaea archaeon]
MKYADLHTHSTHSDGTDSIEEVVEVARERGFNAVAVTDHDTLHEGLDFRVKDFDGVELVNAAEIKAEIDGTKIEILSYFLDTSDENLLALTDRIEELRVERMQEMVDKVNDMVEPRVSIEDVEEEAEGPLGRPHLAKVLEKKDVVESVSKAFDRFIGDDCEGYVATKKLSAEEVINTVRENGGVTSLAHPGRDLGEDAEEKVEKLSELGLDAIEVPYSYDRLENEHGIEMYFKEGKAREIAEKFDLLVSGGSDSHGTGSEKDYIGNVKLEYEKVEKLKERARSRGSQVP